MDAKYSGHGDEHGGYVRDNESATTVPVRLSNREQALDLAWLMSWANQQRKLEQVREAVGT